jgi:hypothetical protein
MVGLKESDLNMGCALVIVLKSGPYLMSRLKIWNMIELMQRETHEKSISDLTIGLVLINLELINPSR